MKTKGWKVGGAKEFLDLSKDERAYLEIKLAFARSLRERRTMRKMTQVELAEMIGSSQSRVAKMEAGDPTVSIDLLVRCLITLGATNKDIARVTAFSKLLAYRSRS